MNPVCLYCTRTWFLRHSILAVLYSFMLPTLFALDRDKAVTQYVMDTWRAREGLPQNHVSAIAQTPDGHLWLGLQIGLVRFDGIRFTLFDKSNTPALAHPSVMTICTARDGSIWFGTYGGGVVCLRNGKFRSWTTREGLSNDFVWSLCEARDGGIWVGTLFGLNRIKDGQVTQHEMRKGSPFHLIMALAEDLAGRLWIGAQEGVACLDNGRFTRYTVQDGLPNNSVYSLALSKKGGIWVGTLGGGLSCFEDGRWKAVPAEPGIRPYNIRALAEDRDGNLWLATTTSGLRRLGPNGFSALTRANGFPADDVYSLREDHEGSLWIGTGSGLFRLKDGKFVTFTTREGLSSNNVYSFLAARDGSYWVGTGGSGLDHIQDGKVRSYTTRDGLAHDTVRCLLQDRAGSIWIGTFGGGLSRYKNGRFTTYSTRNGLLSDYVMTLLEDRAGTLWVALQGGGLNYFRDGQIGSYPADEGLPIKSIRALLEDKEGALWLGTEGGGLVRLKDGRWSVFTTRDGLPENTVLSLLLDQEGVIWIGTQAAGLARLEKGKFTVYDQQCGLFDDVIQMLLEDLQGDLWMGGEKGVYQVGKKLLNEYAAGKTTRVSFVQYDTADGMPSSIIMAHDPQGCCRSRDGRLWFSTNEGLAAIDPAHIKRNSEPPPVFVEAFFNGQPLPAAPDPLHPRGTSHLEFKYAGLSLLVPEKVRFKYMLEGYDPDWIDAGVRRTAYYTNLAPGSYRFRVVSANNDGVWNWNGAAVTFYIAPRFYQTYWFGLICVGIVLATGRLGYHWRVRHLRHRERALVRLVEDRTRELRVIQNELEERVQERTAELTGANQTLYDTVLERRQAEQRLRESQTQLQQALKASKMGVWDWDIETGEILWSGICPQLLGLAPEAAKGSIQAYLKMTHPDDVSRLETCIQKSSQEGADFDLEHRIIWPDGSIHWIVSKGEVRSNEAGRPVHLAGVVMDITNQVQIEERLRQSQKMDAVGRLAGGVAHDFNNLLTAINGYAELLLAAPGDPAMKQYLEEILKAGNRATHLTRQLLAFSRKQVLQPQLLDLNIVVANIEQMLLRLLGEDITLLVRLSGRAAVFKADPGQIEQVIVNLAINARDSMPGGGCLTIETANVSLDENYCVQHPDVPAGAYVRLAVTDTGMGIDPQTLPLIFEPFFTTKGPGKGTGMGLSTVLGIVKQSGGHITVYTEQTHGTTFKVYLPAVSGKVEEAPRPSIAQPAGGTETILLVEDEEVVRKMISTILQNNGYTVLVAQHPEQALSIAGEYSGTIHFLLTDVVMPQMNGREMADRILALRPEIRVLFMSGYTEDVIIHRGILDPGIAFLHKPFTVENLTIQIRRLMESAHRET